MLLQWTPCRWLKEWSCSANDSTGPRNEPPTRSAHRFGPTGHGNRELGSRPRPPGKPSNPCSENTVALLLSWIGTPHRPTAPVVGLFLCPNRRRNRRSRSFSRRRGVKTPGNASKRVRGAENGCGCWTRTNDLQFMRLTGYQLPQPATGGRAATGGIPTKAAAQNQLNTSTYFMPESRLPLEPSGVNHL